MSLLAVSPVGVLRDLGLVALAWLLLLVGLLFLLSVVVLVRKMYVRRFRPQSDLDFRVAQWQLDEDRREGKA